MRTCNTTNVGDRVAGEVESGLTSLTLLLLFSNGPSVASRGGPFFTNVKEKSLRADTRFSGPRGRGLVTALGSCGSSTVPATEPSQGDSLPCQRAGRPPSGGRPVLGYRHTSKRP